MRNKTLKFMLSTLLTVTLLMSCMSMFAQAASVSSATYYHDDSDEVMVVADVRGLTNGSKVTYIATDGTAVSGALTGSHVLYVDQATVTGSSANFTYKFDKSKLNSSVETVVKVGSDTDTFTTNPTDLGLTRITQDIPRGVSVEYFLDEECTVSATDYVDDNSTDLYVQITVDSRVEIETITIDGNLEYSIEIGGSPTLVYQVTESVVITTTQSVVSTGIATAKKVTFFDGENRSYGYLLQRRGNHPDLVEMGVKYNDYLYPALTATVEGESVNPTDANLAQPAENEYVIVVLQFDVDGTNLDKDGGNLDGTPDLAYLDENIIPYYMVYTDDTRTAKDTNVYDQYDIPIGNVE